jgi:hypothetical protein
MGNKTQTAHLGTSKAYELCGAAQWSGLLAGRAVRVYCCAMSPDVRVLQGTQALAVSGTDTRQMGALITRYSGNMHLSKHIL